MKSKSFQLPSNAVDKVKQNKTYDFVNLYKSAGETSVPVEKRKSDDGSCKENVAVNKLFSPRRVNKKKKKTQNESIDISKINIDGDNLLRTVDGATYDSKVTSTPNADKNDMKPKVKSIIKTKPPIDDSLDISNVSISSKPKKRNKSVSFMLDESEGVAIKRSKSEETVHTQKKLASKSLCKTKKPKKFKQKLQDEENKGDANNISIENVPNENIAPSKVNISNHIESPEDVYAPEEKSEKKKHKKVKTNHIHTTNSESVINDSEEPKIKKIKKKKRHIKLDGTDNIDREGEPAQKASKKDIKPEIIAQDLENLNIGDNAHTLTNLLDEMTVVDKNNKKKSKQKDRKRKKDKLRDTRNTDMAETTEGSEEKKKTKEERHKMAESNVSVSTNTVGKVSEGSVTKKKRKQKKPDIHKSNVSIESTNNEGEASESTEEKKKQRQKKQKTDKMDIPIESINTEGEVTEEKEKVKWVNRKWNKDKKAAASADKYLTSVIIENLPLKLLFTYKKLLAEHFGKFGMIRQVGIAEIYPMEDHKPVFTTTINFYSEDAAEKALEEDNTLLEGARVRVKRALPPTLSTLVVRSYAELTEQALSSVFSGAGRIRSIRHMLKGKKSLSTSFVEFDGPKSVERAIKMAEEVKIGGKKIHVAKFELRGTQAQRQDNAPRGDGSEDSLNEDEHTNE